MGLHSRLTFSKSQRLTNVKLIENLFKTNESIKAFPLIFAYNYFIEPALSHQYLFSVAKKRFKKAVDRNRIKRLMKECYRLKQNEFAAFFEDKKTYTAFIYVGSEIPNFETVSKAFDKILSKLNEKNR